MVMQFLLHFSFGKSYIPDSKVSDQCTAWKPKDIFVGILFHPYHSQIINRQFKNSPKIHIQIPMTGCYLCNVGLLDIMQ